MRSPSMWPMYSIFQPKRCVRLTFNFLDASQDLNELLGGLSPQRWGALPATRRKALLQQLWSTVRRKKQDLLFM